MASGKVVTTIHHHLHRGDQGVQLGGIQGALDHFHGQVTPNLLIVETRLKGQEALDEGRTRARRGAHAEGARQAPLDRLDHYLGRLGLPVAGAEVRVTTAAAGDAADPAVLATVRTAADGTARFHPALYDVAELAPFEFVVTGADGRPPRVVKSLHLHADDLDRGVVRGARAEDVGEPVAVQDARGPVAAQEQPVAGAPNTR